MTTQEAISRLRHMQAQIIHGKRTFGDIADLIEALEAENVRRIRHLNRLATWAQQDPTGPLPQWMGMEVQAWVLNEIRCALGQPDVPTAWQPGCPNNEVSEPARDNPR